MTTPLEVENMLLRHPAVAEAPWSPCRIKGEMPAALVKAKGPDVGEEELKRFCLANGPAYAHPSPDRLHRPSCRSMAREDAVAQMIAERTRVAPTIPRGVYARRRAASAQSDPGQ